MIQSRATSLWRFEGCDRSNRNWERDRKLGVMAWVMSSSSKREQAALLKLLDDLRETFCKHQARILQHAVLAPRAGAELQELVRLRRVLYEQVLTGPMTPAQVQRFLSPHLQGFPQSLADDVAATLDEARRDDPR